jgi:hypothetical protein
MYVRPSDLTSLFPSVKKGNQAEDWRHVYGETVCLQYTVFHIFLISEMQQFRITPFFLLSKNVKIKICKTIIFLKNAVFWGVAPCICGRLNRRFGGSYRLHFRVEKSASEEPAWAGSYLLTLGLRSRIFLPWRWRRYDPPKRRFNRPHLHSATPQKTAFFKVTAVKTSNPTYNFLVSDK